MNAIPQRCHDCLVREKALCSSMSDGELAAVSEIGRRKVVPAGEVVSWAGEPNGMCANIVSGALKVTASTADGREQIVDLLFPGDFMGQLFADEAAHTVVTLTESDLCTFPRQRFERTLDDHPRLERMLLQRTMNALEEARDKMLSLGRMNAQERIAGFLLEVARRAGERRSDGTVRLLIPISRGEMADLLGLTIETVSRQLTRLKASGIIAFSKGGRQCEILDRGWLEAVVNPS